MTDTSLLQHGQLETFAIVTTDPVLQRKTWAAEMEQDISFFKRVWPPGRRVCARRALLLDRVMEGHAFVVSHSQLLQLPTDILTDIVDLLADDGPTLASLALVNSTCRQLARSSQFSDVLFYNGPKSSQLIFKLNAEAISRLGSRHRLPSVGVCIRKLTMEGSGWESAARKQFLDMVGSMAGRQFKSKLENLKVDLWNVCIHELILPRALPNLEFLVWKNTELLDGRFFSGIMRTPAQYVKLLRLFFDISGAIDFIEEPHEPSTWPVRFLELDIGVWSPTATDVVAPFLMQKYGTAGTIASQIFDRLFRACAPTLESLTWQYYYDGKELSLPHDGEPISFPRLRFLRVNAQEIPSYILSSFLRAPLRHLLLPEILDFDDMGESLANCGTIRELETLVIKSIRSSEENIARLVNFIGRHEHIRKLHVQEKDWMSGETARINPYIIPLLSKGGFTNLKSLSLGFGYGGAERKGVREEVASIPEEALMVIGTITSLEQLHLSAGGAGAWRYQWLVDHDQLREAFRSLKKLRKLALSRDTYLDPDVGSDTQAYYELKHWTENTRNEAMARPDLDDDLEDLINHVSLWERAHRNRMLAQAERYAAVLPTLEWILFGQRAMTIQEDSYEPGRRIALPLTKYRKRLTTDLNEMFAMGTDHGGV
ncbi:hypothetical protein F5Y05DRAFT_395164 [Hypoxylon sp. FL0543]|nr:hypothetical protein F5Y05DRAFT_395164 [Hypoxylon sp. FL0543]